MNLWIGIALLAVTAAGENVDVSVTLDPPVIPFHRQAQYSISVEAPAEIEVKLPDMVDKFGGLAVADLQRNTMGLKGGRRRIVETYTLDAIFAGNYKIYPATVRWGESESMTVPSPALQVRDLTDEEKQAALQFATIAGPIPVRNPLLRNWQAIAIVAGVALLAALAVAYVYARRKRQALEAPPLPPWEVAYQRLRELDQRQLSKAGKYEPYYVDLSAILRYYIEDRFHVHAPEQTTQEFLSTAMGSGLFSVEQEKLLAGFLRHCDRVKFAQYVPAAAEMDRSFAFVLQFVDDTVPKPEASPPVSEEAAA